SQTASCRTSLSGPAVSGASYVVTAYTSVPMTMARAASQAGSAARTLTQNETGTGNGGRLAAAADEPVAGPASTLTRRFSPGVEIVADVDLEAPHEFGRDLADPHLVDRRGGGYPDYNL